MRPLALATVMLACLSLAWGCSVDALSEGSVENSDEAGAPAESDASAQPAPPEGGPDAALLDGNAADAGDTGCPTEMARILDFCVDRWEAHVAELDDAGVEHPHSPYEPVAGLRVRAKSAASVVPQAYISQLEASSACAAAGKRLCDGVEFETACRGEDAGASYPYGGITRRPGVCNEGKGSAVPLLFGSNTAAWTYDNFNDPRLNQLDGGLSKTGAFPGCVSPHGVFDCVGNLHEWGADPPDGLGHARFRGGFYGDAEANGPGCRYVTRAHAPSYHDYSTGFRCCMDTK
jgi:formylglycine-generating enzyme required for sulfatase activity